MPTLIVEDLPQDIYDCLLQRALADQRSLRDEAVAVLQNGLNPSLVSISPPCDLPRGPGVRVPYIEGSHRLPVPSS